MTKNGININKDKKQIKIPKKDKEYNEFFKEQIYKKNIKSFYNLSKKLDNMKEDNLKQYQKINLVYQKYLDIKNGLSYENEEKIEIDYIKDQIKENIKQQFKKFNL